MSAPLRPKPFTTDFSDDPDDSWAFDEMVDGTTDLDVSQCEPVEADCFVDEAPFDTDPVRIG